MIVIGIVAVLIIPTAYAFDIGQIIKPNTEDFNLTTTPPLTEQLKDDKLIITSKTGPSTQDVTLESNEHYVINTSEYAVSLGNNDSYTSWGSIRDVYINDYDPAVSPSGSYLAIYPMLYTQSPATYEVLPNLMTTDGSTVLTNGTYQTSVEYNFGSGDVYLYWYFYEKYFIGRIHITTGYGGSTYNDGFRANVLVCDDTDATAGNDYDTLNWARGTKLTTPTDTTTATTSGSYDTFDYSSTLRGSSTWYGNSSSSDLFLGSILGTMPTGATNYASYAYDAETTGADYTLGVWTYSNWLGTADFDRMWVVVVPGGYESATKTNQVLYTMRYPATIECISGDCSSPSFASQRIIYQATFQDTADKHEFNITGNANWINSVETIYVRAYDVSNNTLSLYDNTTGTPVELLDYTEIQWEGSGQYDAIFPINQSKSTENTYVLMEPEASDTTVPVINSVSDTPDPVEYDSWINISANVTDDVDVDTVTLEIDGSNTTTTESPTDIYWNNHSVVGEALGVHNYTFYANDTSGNPAVTSSGTYTVQDTTSPIINSVSDTPDPVEYNSLINISANVTDGVDVDTVTLEIDGVNYTTTESPTDVYWNNHDVTGEILGVHNYTFYANDTSSNAAITSSGTYTVQDTTDPVVTWNSTVPADIDNTNLFSTRLNVTYNMTDGVALDTDTLLLYYKTNTSTSDVTYFTNGTAYYGWFTKEDSSSTGDLYSFLPADNQVYPATYNFDEYATEHTTHSVYDLDSNSKWLKMELLDVSTTAENSYLEFMINNTDSSGTIALPIYYCNSSYTTGNPTADSNCVNFYNMPAQQYWNHSHGPSVALSDSSHMLVPFPIVSGEISGVPVTSTSYFLFRGDGGINAYDAYYITNISRSDAIQTSSDNGTSWSNFAGTLDGHLHQFDNTSTFYYYACANDTSGNQDCETIKSDQLQFGAVGPTSPVVTNPTSTTYEGDINITYLAAVPYGSAEIDYYSISLADEDEVVLSTIIANNSDNLYYLWDSTSTGDGTYTIRVKATDNQSLVSYGYSQVFTLSNEGPTIADVTDIPDPILKGQIINISANITDQSTIANVDIQINGNNYTAVDGAGDIYYKTYDTTGDSGGIHYYKVYAQDEWGNPSVSATYNYTVLLDEDGDGYNDSVDCDDNDFFIFPLLDNYNHTISVSGNYTTCGGTDNPRINITVDDVEINFNDTEVYQTDSDPTPFIQSTGHDNITIYNVNVYDYMVGMYFEDCNDVWLGARWDYDTDYLWFEGTARSIDLQEVNDANLIWVYVQDATVNSNVRLINTTDVLIQYFQGDQSIVEDKGGIDLQGSETNFTLRDSTMTDCTGIDFSDSGNVHENISVINNTFDDIDGMTVNNVQNFLFENNTMAAGGIAWIFVTNEDATGAINNNDLAIDIYLESSAVDFTNNNVSESGITVDVTGDYSGDFSGNRFENSAGTEPKVDVVSVESFAIHDNVFIGGNAHGIYLRSNADFCEIYDNEFIGMQDTRAPIDTSFYAIKVDFSNQAKIYENYFENNSIDVGVTAADFTEIYNNTFNTTSGGFGTTQGAYNIYIYNSDPVSTLIENNTFLLAPSKNIYMNEGLNTFIKYNTFNDSNFAIDMDAGVSGSEVYNNTFNNVNIGWDIAGDSNEFYNNVFDSSNDYNVLITGTGNELWNNEFDDVVWSNGTSTTWYITPVVGPNIIGGDYKGGNYYPAYNGTDISSPPDGIGDTIYTVPGSEGTTDLYPLTLDHPTNLGGGGGGFFNITEEEEEIIPDAEPTGKIEQFFEDLRSGAPGALLLALVLVMGGYMFFIADDDDEEKKRRIRR